MNQRAEMRRKPLRLLVIYWLSHSCLAQAPADCDALRQTAGDEALIVRNSEGSVLSRRGPGGEPQTKYGRLRAIAVVEDDEIREARNAVLEKGESLWSVLDAGQELVLSEVHSLNFLARPGDSYCLFSAEADSSNVETHALFTNEPAFRLRPPTAA